LFLTFGVDTIECWLGKDGKVNHGMHEVAAAAIAHLSAVINAAPHGTIKQLAGVKEIGDAMPPPWDEYWRSQRRTASWRS